ncbi:MAG: ribonuclease P protein component [Anaerolineae bacterium]|nr:ribonuclease P protein component [Anaerolineae bacterium]
MQRHWRLRRTEDFARLRATGRVRRHPFLILSVAPNHLSHNRYGFVTSKRLGKAVVRSRIRRLLREVVRRAHPYLTPGFDLVFVARPPIVGQTYQAIDKTVVSSLKKAGLWQSPAGEQKK